MSGMNEIASWRREGAVAVLKIDSPPVNALSHAVRIALHEGVTRAAEDDAVKALVILCGGRTFFAGADITEFGKPIQPPLLKNIMAVIEASTKPVIAAMHGNALGGGLEVALACHYRVALASTRIGLPESALGLLPGAGGTQRVPRLIGVEKAVEMIVFGEPYPAPRARELGLIDAVIAGDDLEAGAIAYALELVDGNAPLRRVRDQAPDLDRDAARALFARFRADHPKLFRNLRAPENILRAIEAAVILPFDEGIAREAELSRELVASPESAAQRHIFFAERAAAKLPAKVAEDAVPTIAAVRIVGDHTDDLSAIFARAGFSLARDGVAEADLVVITADNPDEYAAQVRTAAHAAPRALIAVTGAWEALDRIAGASGRPDGVFGLNLRPANATGDVLEIARTATTGAGALAAALNVARKLRRMPVVVAAGDGLLIARMTECLQEHAATSGIAARWVRQVLDDLDFTHGLAAPDDAAPETNAATREEVIEKVLYPVVAEAFAMLDAGALWRGSDIDAALVKSGFWPVHMGGPIHWASRVGHRRIVDSLIARGIAVPASLREHAEKEAPASA